MKNAPIVMEISRVLLIALASGHGLLVLSGCAGPASTYRDPAYSRQEFRDGPVAFMPMRFTEVGLEAFEEFRKAFPKETDNGGETKLANAFNSAFLNSARLKVKEIRLLDSGPAADPNRHFETQQLLDKGRKSQSAMRIHIPTKGAVDSTVPPARFVITARNVNFSYRVEEKAGYMTPGHAVSTPAGSLSKPGGWSGGGKSKVIQLTMRFMVWDYQADAPVSYGKYTAQMSASYFFTQGEWLRMMENAARYVAQHLP